ncbi:hypothetical protein ALC57_10847, partial [Trachymyrmex cornetzi]
TSLFLLVHKENKENDPSLGEITDIGVEGEELINISEQEITKDCALKVLGMDPSNCKFKEISMMLDPPEEGLDEEIFTDYISHAGQILTDVFHQRSIARKLFITNIKHKTPQKYISKFREQGNSKYPPVGYRQVGQQQRRRQMKFKTRPYKNPQGSAKTSQTTNESSSKK